MEDDKEHKGQVTEVVSPRASKHESHSNYLFGLDPAGIRKLSSTRPAEYIPIITKGSSNMPGEAFVSDMERIGDRKVSDMVAGGGYIKPDLTTIVPHYLKGLSIKDTLGQKLNLGDRQGYIDCALGYGLNSHYYTDEFGLSMTENKKFPDFIIKAAFKYLKSQTSDARNSLIKEGKYEAVNLDEYDKDRKSVV